MLRATLQIVQQKFLLFKISKVGNHLRIPIYQKKKKKKKNAEGYTPNCSAEVFII